MPVQIAQYQEEMMAETPRVNKVVEFDENDEKIIAATLKAFESGSLTPLIKEELRCTIQSRRIAEGKGEMAVEFKTPVRKKEMNDDERKRALKRRQQNREAAQRFRQRQKDTSDYLTAKIRRLEKSANALTEQMNSLREEKELLGQMLNDHLTVCSNPNLVQTEFVLDESAFVQVPAQTPFSTSSMDSNFTYYDDSTTPNTAVSDTSVFFSDELSPVSDIQDIDSTHLQRLSVSSNGNELCKSYSNDFNAENIIVYDGPLDACYEEIIIDIAETDAECLRNDARTRGDSCSSVDTVSSYCGAMAPELTPLSECSTSPDLRDTTSPDCSVPTHSTTPGHFDQTVNMADDLFFVNDNSL